MNESFWDWFAGFCDGEACFSLMKGTTNGVINARIAIALRADDVGVIEYIRDNLGCGLIGWRKRTTAGSGDQVTYEVLTVDGCLLVANNLRGRLRAKKAYDLRLWAEALEILDRQGGGSATPEYSRLLALKAEMSAAKRFNEAISRVAEERHGKRKSEDGHYLRRSKWTHVEPLPVEEIRAKYASGKYSQAALAREYEIHKMTVNQIVRGKYRLATIGELPDIRPRD